MITQNEIIDGVLRAHSAALGADIVSYRNHVYRVTNLCLRFAGGDVSMLPRIATAAVFHDIGIWTDGTFDYLAPSIKQAMLHLNETGNAEWANEVTAMIDEHHKVLPYKNGALSLVEPFRKADWVDVSWGVLRHGTPRVFVRQLYRQWPDAGFHLKLVRLSAGRLATHPWSPLPMMRL